MATGRLKYAKTKAQKQNKSSSDRAIPAWALTQRCVSPEERFDNWLTAKASAMVVRLQLDELMVAIDRLWECLQTEMGTGGIGAHADELFTTDACDARGELPGKVVP